MNKKVVTFGEIMLRLSTPGFSRFVQAEKYDVTFGGGEANVAVSLANYGLNSFFVTKLPKNDIGQSAVNHLRRFGVNTEHVLRGGDRVGIYFLETGASQRPSKVIYDRAGSAVSEMNSHELDWSAVFAGVDWFHWTGITPALGKAAQENLATACKAAKKAGARISCDLNFRAKLWTEQEAQRVMKPLMEHVDLCIANEEDAEKSLGLKFAGSDVDKGELDVGSYFNGAQKMKKEFNFEAVSLTLRESFSASHNGWSGMLLDEADCKKPYHSKRYDIQIVDRVGGGDAFAGGLIYGLLSMDNTREALEFAVAASCLKQTIPGDSNFVTVEEVQKLAKGSGSGRVER